MIFQNSRNRLLDCGSYEIAISYPILPPV